jgi:nitrate reductase cytochrome c-type subunit
MLDKCSDKTEATLFSTYRIRHKTCVFVHINHTARKPTKTKKLTVTTMTSSSQRKTKQSTTRTPSATIKQPPPRRHIIRDNRVVSIPFGDFKCPVCHNNEGLKKCLECGCSKCLYKTGDPLVSYEVLKKRREFLLIFCDMDRFVINVINTGILNVLD